MVTESLTFIDEKIEVWFDTPPLYSKNTGHPDGFRWRGRDYRITDLLQEKHDYHRRGRMSRNMQPQHATVAEGRGSRV